VVFYASKLTPIKLYFSDRSIWRVPLHISEGHYTLFVNTGFTRTFDDKTLPYSLRGAIAMILVSDYQYLSSDEEVNEYNIFTVPPPPPLGIDTTWFDIGWRISPSWFCMCMETSKIVSLKGIINETTNNTNDDI